MDRETRTKIEVFIEMAFAILSAGWMAGAAKEGQLFNAIGFTFASIILFFVAVKTYHNELIEEEYMNTQREADHE